MANAFESGQRKVIPAVLVYIRSADDRVLMIHRLGGAVGASGIASGKPGDYHAGKWNGLGGKLELDESPIEAARREVREEAGLDLAESDFHVLGTLQFPNFKAHKNEDWMVFVLTAQMTAPASEIRLGACPEGELHWIPSSDLESLNLWAGDRHFIPFVKSRTPFVGTLWYQGQDVVRHWIQSSRIA